LQQRRYFIVQTDLLCNLAVLDTQNGRAHESHLVARSSRKAADKKIAIGRARVRTAADPASDHIVSLSDELRDGLDAGVGERLTELRHSSSTILGFQDLPQNSDAVTHAVIPQQETECSQTPRQP
jgi:hypothetical protein